MEQDSPKIGIPSFTRETYSIGESLTLLLWTGQTIVAMVSGIYDMIRGTGLAELSNSVGISKWQVLLHNQDLHHY